MGLQDPAGLAPKYNLTVTTWERFNLDDKDMTAQLTKIKGTNPQAIINWSIPPTASTAYLRKGYQRAEAP